MKKLITFLIFVIFATSSYCQLLTPNGIKIGKIKTGTSIITIDSLIQYSTRWYRHYKGSAIMYPIPDSTTGANTFATDHRVDVLEASKANWDTAYAARLRWSGTPTGLTAATARASLHVDTVYIDFEWNVGVGAAIDTALFRKWAPHAYSYGSYFWDGPGPLIITKLIAKISSGGSVTLQVSWDANDEDATPTVLNNSPPTITSSTSGNVDVSFDNSSVSADNWIWLTTPSVTTQPIKLRVTLKGYTIH